MIIKIHDLPIKHPMDGVSFHAIPDATLGWLSRIWWDGEALELVTTDGAVWTLDWATGAWEKTGDVGSAL